MILLHEHRLESIFRNSYNTTMIIEANMKKIIPVMIVSLLVLSSCNFPLFKTSAVSASEVSTKVAQTLQAVATEEITATFTPIPLTTATATPTATVSPTPTTSPEDPRVQFGTPTFSESFDSGSSFGLKTPYTDDAITMSVANGEMTMQSSRLNGGIHWRLAYLTPRNLYLEGTFTTVNCSGSDFYGLVMRSPTYTDGTGYYFAVTCGGQFGLYRMDGAGNFHALQDLRSDPAFLAGSGQTNRVGVLLQDSHFTFYLNGKLVGQIDNSDLPDKGYFGVFQSAQETANMTIKVEQIDEWNRP
jgi:hypothetical protein